MNLRVILPASLIFDRLGQSAADILTTRVDRVNFPDDIENIIRPGDIPLSRAHFELAINTFRLPMASSWLLYTHSGHFQYYDLGRDVDKPAGAQRIGNFKSLLSCIVNCKLTFYVHV